MAASAIEREGAETALSKSELAYQSIKARISSGDYSAGYRLVLSSIAKDLDVSVVPVREAIRRLEAEGLVTFERNVGAQVAMIEPTEYLYTMQTLSVIEGVATAMSAPHIAADAIKRARAINAQMSECLDHLDPHRFTELNREFHQVLFEKCPNLHILGLVFRGWNRLRALRDSVFAFVPGRARQSVTEHEQLLQLVEANASSLEIELATREHRMATLDAYLAYQAEMQKHSHRNPQRTTTKNGEYR